MNSNTVPDWSRDELRTTQSTPDWFNEAVAWPMHSGFVTVDECRIHYLRWESPPSIEGRGNGLLFVHGGGAHANWWRFIAPQLANSYVCAAIDLSGMGDSGRRETYDAEQRSAEMQAVIEAAGLGPRAVVVGHSFGGYMTMRLAAHHGSELGGVVIVDSPIRTDDDEEAATRRRAINLARHYPSFDIGVERFRLMPVQSCANEFLVEFIARHSLRETESGWTWKFDVGAMGSRRWEEPFAEHCANMSCRQALIYGQHSALVSSRTVAHMRSLMDPSTPVIEIPDAQHHIMLDQPLAFVSALRSILAGWSDQR